MKSIFKAIKILATLLLVPLYITGCYVGMTSLYGGPDGNAFSTNALIGTATGAGAAAIATLLALALWKFEKRAVLASLILHETILLLGFIPMVIATIFSKEIPQIMVHPIVLLALIAGGYGICKTVKAIKTENKDL